MPRYVLDLDLGAPPDWEPLERLLGVLGRHPLCPHIAADDFMFMGRLVATQRPPVLMYKHAGSRRYLYIDHAGHTFRVTDHDRNVCEAMGVVCTPLSSPVDAVVAVAVPVGMSLSSHAGRAAPGIVMALRRPLTPKGGGRTA